jgi:DNA-binding transcriptional MerR regulator
MNRNRRSTEKSEPKKKAAARPSDASATDDRGLKIGEAAKVIGVEAYVLRFWETQFAVLKPKHARSKHRFYLPRDIETLKLIKRLLHQEGFTIAGANKYIRENGIDPSNIASSADASRPTASSGASMGTATRRALAEVRRDLVNIHKLLGDE